MTGAAGRRPWSRFAAASTLPHSQSAVLRRRFSMVSSSTAIAALLALAIGAAAAAPSDVGGPQLPEYIEVCNRNAPDRDACMAEKLQKLIPFLAEGTPELGLPPIDPHVVPEMLLQYKQGEVAGKMLIRNSRTTGVANGKVLGIRSTLNDSNTFRMEVDLFFPSIFVEGNYKAQGKIVVFPIDGKGVYNISMTGINTTWNMTGTHIMKRGRAHVRIDSFSMFPDLQDMKVYASNLFTGNEDFNRAALQFANDYWQVIYQELLPYANEAWDKVLRGLANKVFLKFPFNTLFPEGDV